MYQAIDYTVSLADRELVLSIKIVPKRSTSGEDYITSGLFVRPSCARRSTHRHGICESHITGKPHAHRSSTNTSFPSLVVWRIDVV